MAREKLKEAFELIQQGEKNQAQMIVRGVLREDSQNADAWWLMANLLDEEDKVIKALDKVLELNPNHGGARKKLASMRPELARNFAPMTVDKVKPAQAGGRANGCLQALAMRVIGFIIILALAGAYGFWTEGLPRMQQDDANGQTPADVVLAYTIAGWYEDIPTLRALSCDAMQYRVDEVEQQIAELGELASDYKADTSNVTTEVVRLKLNEATVALHGSVYLSSDGETYDYNYDQDAREQNVDWIWEHLKRIDGVWLICDGPDEVYE